MNPNLSAGQMPLSVFGSDYNVKAFIIQQLLSRIHTVTLVEVMAVTNAGGVSPSGFVDVMPLVNQMTGAGVAQKHRIISHCPYYRDQGGANAIINDPQVGDIGIAIFAERDISNVVKTWAQANPGSFRKYDMSDCIYVGGGFNVTPTTYIQFSGGAINIVSPVGVTVTTPLLKVNGAIKATGNITAGAIDLETHVHTGVTTGSSSTGGPTG